MKQQNPSSTPRHFTVKNSTPKSQTGHGLGPLSAVHRKDGASMGGLFSFALEPSNVSFGEGFEVQEI